MMGSWSARLFLHVLGYLFFFDNRLGFVLGLHCLNLIYLCFCEYRWLLRHLPYTDLHGCGGGVSVFGLMMFHFWTMVSAKVIIVPCGTWPHVFVGSGTYSGGSQRMKTSLVVRLFLNNEHPFPGWSLFSSYRTLHPSFWLSDIYISDVHVNFVPALSQYIKYQMA